MYYIAWDDHTGQRHERQFDSLEDAKCEAAGLMRRADVEYVEYGPI